MEGTLTHQTIDIFCYGVTAPCLKSTVENRKRSVCSGCTVAHQERHTTGMPAELGLTDSDFDLEIK